jgi:PhnB protein
MTTQKSASIQGIEPYLYFDGCCEEALEFYKKELGAEVCVMLRFKESPDPTMCPPGSGDKIMHTSFKIGGTTILGSDGRCGGKHNFQGFSLSLKAANDAEAERLFAVLSKDGKIEMPLMKTFFSSRFGMVADRFGVPWMIVVEK